MSCDENATAPPREHLNTPGPSLQATERRKGFLCTTGPPLQEEKASSAQLALVSKVARLQCYFWFLFSAIAIAFTIAITVVLTLNLVMLLQLSYHKTRIDDFCNVEPESNLTKSYFFYCSH